MIVGCHTLGIFNALRAITDADDTIEAVSSESSGLQGFIELPRGLANGGLLKGELKTDDCGLVGTSVVRSSLETYM